MQSAKSFPSSPLFFLFARVTALSASASAASLSWGALGAPIYQQIDYPGGTDAQLVRVDDNGDAAGYYHDEHAYPHGLIRDGVTGTVRSFDCPGAIHTVPDYIANQNGSIRVYGTYYTASGGPYGFTYDDDSGTCTTWQRTKLPTDVTGANVNGNTTGTVTYGTASHTPSLQVTGYLRKPSGKFITINVPDATYSVHPMGLNNKNVVTGDYDGKGGFVWPLSTKTATEFACAGVNTTLPVAINDKGVITGGCGNYNPQQGFVRDGSGNITLFTPSLGGTSQTIYVYPQSINSYGTITGWFEAQTSYGQPFLDHGFIRNKKGTIKVFDYPHAQGEPFGTHPLAINDNNVIVGYYVENGVTHGFERDP